MVFLVVILVAWILVSVSGATLIGRAIAISKPADPLDQEYRELIAHSR